jgi:hypothetical protein
VPRMMRALFVLTQVGVYLHERLREVAAGR